MSIEVSNRTESPRRGWWSRWLSRGDGPRSAPAPGAARPDLARGSIRGAVRDLLAHDRYVFALLRAAAEHVEDRDAAPALATLGREMALVPGGMVPVVRADGQAEVMEVPAFYLDRRAVTNRQFQRFVAAGCYDLLEIWPREAWPGLMKLTDRSGRPGPAGWEQGKFPAGLADHPVVGVCWYEALAYARWVGKRLPTAAEWQKAGGWPEQLSGGTCNRYPWGDLFDPTRANLWTAGLGATAPVDAFPNGDTPNGIRQMTGNVWEWLDDPLEAIPCHPDEAFQAWRPLRRIIGGAFDTYLPGEATCHFITGQGEMDRRNNIGFRCAVAADQLRDAP
jgi:gamma-glutamyl hercynylcysteine S-oxide synthase